MKIKEPKFKVGDKVRDIEDGTIFTLTNINSYGFDYDEYWYDLECDGLTWTRPESKLELYQETPKTVWDLQKSDKCCFIDDCGTVLSGTWADISYAIKCRQTGNVFLTKEEAESESERRKIETEMLRLGGRRKLERNRDNYGIYYSNGINVTLWRLTMNQGSIYFDTRKEAEDAIEHIGRDRLKKYIFGVDE